MEQTEIYLSKLASYDELYDEAAKKLGAEHIADSGELRGLLCSVGEDVKYMIYESNEDIVNDTVREVIEDEFLNLIDDEARLTAQSKPRSLVHRDGELHPAVHIWIIKRKDMGIYVLLQKRSHEKRIAPDCYDVSAAGHVGQGEEFRSTAVRETAEELGLKIHGSRLELIGLMKNSYSAEGINDNELRAVYLCREDVDVDRLVLQSSEVSDVCWAEIDELLAVMDEGEFKHCISLDELALIKKAVF